MEETKHDVHNVHSGSMLTASGTKISLTNPNPAAINIHDIARGLSNTCRFGGQINGFYSVAQHSVLVALIAPPEKKKLALLHDASEAYVHDIIKPLKIIIGNNYAEIEEVFMKRIFLKFNLDYSELASIKPYDKLALQYEHDHFHSNDFILAEYFRKNFSKYPTLWNPAIGYEIYYKQLFNETIY